MGELQRYPSLTRIGPGLYTGRLHGIQYTVRATGSNASTVWIGEVEKLDFRTIEGTRVEAVNLCGDIIKRVAGQ